MIAMNFDKLAADLTATRLQQFNSKIRRQVLLKVGNAAAKPIVTALKAGDIPVVSGGLRRAMAKKVKAYPGRNVVFVIAGPKSKKTVVSAYDYYRKQAANKGRKRRGAYRSSMRTLNPAHYAHLAGPGRHSDLVPRVRASTKTTVVETIRAVLATETAKL